MGGVPATDSTTEPKTRDQVEAQLHFQRAKDLYQTGAYREAIAELEQARQLDPKAKDLVFNLGIVHEKLAKFDEAVAFFRQFLDMEGVTPQERLKAETILKRIEGAKREVVLGSAPQVVPRPVDRPPPAPDKTPGRVDVATILAGSVAVVGLGVGSAFGLLAVSNKPGANEFTTGTDGSYDTLRSKSSDAHTQAIVADVGFGVGIAAAALTAYLYFGRPRDARAARQAIRPSAVATPNGGALMLGGTF
jgi:tetratricopeptide (TPR) repeat protein